ncbi:MAG: LysR substrate-binding domain-containing protein [Candidatus Nanopelagicales bacterium]|jgi:DNA-binding transcriptional LysR family regulator|nr:LysR substrate-binding domain-containing protein [Candidatus Nanopelagicales bacterium]
MDGVVSPERLLDGRLKLRHLVLATAIADAGSLARAAEHLRITQPVVTRGLQDLESVLGVPLFERSAQGAVPTVYGVAFIDHARGVLAQIRQAGRTLNELATADAGTVTVGTHLAGSNVLLPLAIARMKSAHPGVTIVVRESTPDALEAQLLVGDIDLTVGRLTPADPRIEQVRLYVEPIVLVVRADHPVLHGPVPTFATLAALPWIVPVSGTTLRRELEQLFALRGLTWPTNRVECTSALTLRRLIIDGDCVAALPGLVALHDDDLAVVRPVDVDLGGLTRPVGVSRVRDRWAPPAVVAFTEHLHQAAARLHLGADPLESG